MAVRFTHRGPKIWTNSIWPALRNGVASRAFFESRFALCNISSGKQCCNRHSSGTTSFAASFRYNRETFFFRRFTVEVHARYDA
mgnify:CR=1 FL=1